MQQLCAHEVSPPCLYAADKRTDYTHKPLRSEREG